MNVPRCVEILFVKKGIAFVIKIFNFKINKLISNIVLFYDSTFYMSLTFHG